MVYLSVLYSQSKFQIYSVFYNDKWDRTSACASKAFSGSAYTLYHNRLINKLFLPYTTFFVCCLYELCIYPYPLLKLIQMTEILLGHQFDNSELVNRVYLQRLTPVS